MRQQYIVSCERQILRTQALVHEIDIKTAAAKPAHAAQREFRAQRKKLDLAARTTLADRADREIESGRPDRVAQNFEIARQAGAVVAGDEMDADHRANRENAVNEISGVACESYDGLACAKALNTGAP